MTPNKANPSLLSISNANKNILTGIMWKLAVSTDEALQSAFHACAPDDVT
jgi:hypothetical protein